MYRNKIINKATCTLILLIITLICGCQKNYNLKEPTFLKMGTGADFSNAEIVFNISDEERGIFGKKYPVYRREATELTRTEILETFKFTENQHISEDFQRENSLFSTYKDGDRSLNFYTDGKVYYNDNKRNNEMDQPIMFTTDDIWDMAETYLKERNMLPKTYIRSGTFKHRINDKLFKLGVGFKPTYNGCNTFGGSRVTVVYNIEKEVSGVHLFFTPHSYLQDTITIEYEEAIKDFPWENSALGFQPANIQEVKKVEFTHCELQYYDYIQEELIQPCFMFTGLVYDEIGNSTPIEYAVYGPVK